MTGLAFLLLAAQAAPATDGLPIGVLPKQELPAQGCAAYLFTLGDNRTLIAMASADPARLRLTIDGAVIDAPRTAQTGAGSYGFAATADYETANVKAVLDMTIVTRADLKDGAAVQQGTLRVDRAGQDSVVVPVAGIIGCKA